MLLGFIVLCIISLLLQKLLSLCCSITTFWKESLFNKCPVCSLRTLLCTRVLITLSLFLPLSHASPFYCIVEFWLWSIRSLIPVSLYAEVHINLFSADPFSRTKFIPCVFIYCSQTNNYGRRPAAWYPIYNGTVICIWRGKASTFPVQREPHSCRLSEQTLLRKCFLLLQFFLA